jgi:hypothetical protein
MWGEQVVAVVQARSDSSELRDRLGSKPFPATA